MSPLAPSFIGTMRKHLMQHLGQLIILGLATQVVAAQETDATVAQISIASNPQGDLKSSEIGSGHKQAKDPFDLPSDYFDITPEQEKWLTDAINYGEALLNAGKKNAEMNPVTPSSKHKRHTDDPLGVPSSSHGITDERLTLIANALKNATEEISSTTNAKPAFDFDSALNSMINHVQNQANYIVQQVNFLQHIEANNKMVDNLVNSQIEEISNITDHFNAKLTECQQKIHNQEASKESNGLNIRLRESEKDDATIHFWASKIKHGEYKSASSVFKTIENNTISKYLPNIIRKSYEHNLHTFEFVLEFINDLPWLSHQYQGYKLLLTEITSNKSIYKATIIRLAYNVKRLTAKVNEVGGSLEAELGEPLNNLKNQFPIEVRNLIWNGSCTMRNVVHDEYMYAAADDLKRRSGDRRVFTWIPDKYGDNWKIWKFESQDDAKYFHISNVVWNDNKYLSEDTSSSSSTKQFAITLAAVACDINCHNGTNWKLEFGDYFFKILNTQSNKYLYAADDELNYDSERRNVLTTEPNASLSNIWDLQCKSAE